MATTLPSQNSGAQKMISYSVYGTEHSGPNEQMYLLLRHGGASDALRLFEQLESLENLENGWDTFDSPAPSHAAVSRARNVLQTVLGSGLRPDAVVPSAEGGVGLVFSGQAKRYADIECLNSEELLVVTSDRVSDPKVWDIGGDLSLEETIERIATFLVA